jgi:hypothetical protein
MKILYKGVANVRKVLGKVKRQFKIVKKRFKKKTPVEPFSKPCRRIRIKKHVRITAKRWRSRLRIRHAHWRWQFRRFAVANYGLFH